MLAPIQLDTTPQQYQLARNPPLKLVFIHTQNMYSITHSHIFVSANRTSIYKKKNRGSQPVKENAQIKEN